MIDSQMVESRLQVNRRALLYSVVTAHRLVGHPAYSHKPHLLVLLLTNITPSVDPRFHPPLPRFLRIISAGKLLAVRIDDVVMSCLHDLNQTVGRLLPTALVKA
jgi:hypothetical protein